MEIQRCLDAFGDELNTSKYTAVSFHKDDNFSSVDYWLLIKFKFPDHAFNKHIVKFQVTALVFRATFQIPES